MLLLLRMLSRWPSRGSEVQDLLSDDPAAGRVTSTLLMLSMEIRSSTVWWPGYEPCHRRCLMSLFWIRPVGSCRWVYPIYPACYKRWFKRWDCSWFKRCDWASHFKPIFAFSFFRKYVVCSINNDCFFTVSNLRCHNRWRDFHLKWTVPLRAEIIICSMLLRTCCTG